MHAIRGYTVCTGEKDLQAKQYNIFERYNLTSLDMYNGLSKVYCIKPQGRISKYYWVDKNHIPVRTRFLHVRVCIRLCQSSVDNALMCVYFVF